LLYEQQLVVISGASAVAMLVAIAVAPRPDAAVVARFMRTVRPFGWWPSLADAPPADPVWPAIGRWALLVAALLVVLRVGVGLMIG
jgi:hypothetical protein